jgi:uncharacterized damage-inducible protein DinB
MKKYFGGVLLSFALSISATAQTAPAAPPASQQPAAPRPATPVSTYLKNYYMQSRNFLAKAAEKMPEENYGMRPGSQEEVRTFGQIIGHVANANMLFCSRAKGEKSPATTDFEKVTAKADLVKGLNDSFAYCDALYNTLTDASLMETVTLTGQNGQQVLVIRAQPLITNVAHNNEHYGNLVTYFRIKAMVPPSSEPAPPK